MTREEAISRLKEGAPFSELYIRDWEEALEMAIKALEQEPKTGHWIEGEIWEDTDGDWGRWQKCSICRQSKHHKTNFCPNCGAEMESED